MAGKQRPKKHALSAIQQLAREPYAFEFFQAVRLIELATCTTSAGESRAANPVGLDFSPSNESVRFRALPSQSFPSSEVADLKPGNAAQLPHQQRVPQQMTVAFMGLTGPSGVLPQLYTQHLIDELREDRGMQQFFDIFNHRVISHFYRVWKKYRFSITYEAFARSESWGSRDRTEDPFTLGLFCLAGMGTSGLRGQQQIPDEGLLHYAGLFAHQLRNAVSLERMIHDYFGLPTELLQFQGQWMCLTEADQTRLSASDEIGGFANNNRLGVNAIAGTRVWGVESKFRVRLGPLDYAKFWELTPGGKQLKSLAQFVRSYVGPDLDFEIQPVLKRQEVPACQLATQGDIEPHLGWNTWIRSLPMHSDGEEAVFQVEGWPDPKVGGP